MAKRVLICDDEANILESIKHIVSKEGYEVLSADNGADGLELAKSEKPDLVILDVMMPKMTGYEVCEAIKQNPELASSKVMILTARGHAISEATAKGKGADEFMAKPFSPKDLRAKLHELLD